MIHTKHRFQGRGSLRFVYQKGQTVRGQYANMRYILNRRNQYYRAAVVVSKRVHKSAVVRNRIRRRIYEIIRTELRGDLEPYDMAVTVYNEQLASVPADQLRQIVVDLLKKASIL